MIKISKRLQTIADFIPDNIKIVDIGCDHGLLDIYLYLNRTNINIIASDVNVNALMSAQNNIIKYGLENSISTVLSNGLDNISANEIDFIVISGMGTSTIIDILTKDYNKLSNVKDMVIQSNNQYYLLRKKICNIGYYISDERIVKDNNKYYTIIKFSKGSKKYSDYELKYGPILIKNIDYCLREYWLEEITKKEKILECVDDIGVRKEIKELKNLIK